METRFDCPRCGAPVIDLHQYESMVVVQTDMALFEMCCPACQARFSCVRSIPEDMKDQVRLVADEVDAGMGQDS